ncbi:hypothetical protein L1049_019295 [Liquidambar formosana]|uniref:Uncharacterized protein n=1 Tax=Liquidambar formosana TaxID=63359 RepID=A0AAP0SCD2_LIQFO
MGRRGHQLGLLARAMEATGTTVGGGVRALAVDGVMGQARVGLLTGLVRVLDLVLGLDLGVGPAQGLDTGVAVLVVEGMGLGVVPVILAAVAQVAEVAVPVATAETETTMANDRVVNWSEIFCLCVL